jgi:hypothetical protein
VAVALFLLLRVFQRERHDLERIIIDEHTTPKIAADPIEVLAK